MSPVCSRIGRATSCMAAMRADRAASNPTGPPPCWLAGYRRPWEAATALPAFRSIGSCDHEGRSHPALSARETLSVMSRASGDRARKFLAALHVGDICTGTATEIRRHGVSVTLDGFPARPLGTVGPLELSWRQAPATAIKTGQRITAEVVAVDLDAGQAQLSMAATENPELWAFLKPLRRGEILDGTVAAIERFGVFVALDKGPAHPVFPGVGFITYPELSWAASSRPRTSFRSASVSCEFLQFDTWNGEARLSRVRRSRTPSPPSRHSIMVGRGRCRAGHRAPVTFGFFVAVADGVEGLVYEAPEDAVRVGDGIAVVVTEIDRAGHRLALARRQIPPARE